MRFQAFAVIFIAIILPISMVLSYYIEIQSETIALESQYQSRLNNATYAAVSAYQMNSLNTQRVAGESIYSYVDASINSFYTTLATSMLQSNASKNMFKNYIPAILFTTYDGYYIYSPYKAAVAAVNIENGQNVLTSTKELVYMSNKKTQEEVDYRIPKETAEDISTKLPSALSEEFTTDVTKARMDYNYKLKPFIYYSAEYKGTGFDFVASYSLDNYLTLSGKVNDTSGNQVSFSKSGYVINPKDVSIKGDFLVRTCQRGNDGKSLASKLVNDTANNVIDEDSIQDYYDTFIQDTKPDDPVKFEILTVDVNNGSGTDPIEPYIWDYTYNSGTNNNKNGYYYTQITTNDDKSAIQTTRYQTGDRLINDTIALQDWFGASAGRQSKYVTIYNNHTTHNHELENVAVTYKGVNITDSEAKKYYIKAYYYSKWVNKYLSNIPEKSVHENKQIDNEKHRTDYVVDNSIVYAYFDNSDVKIFKFDETNDPSSETSPFATHKAAIIKNSIQTNLNAAISNFNEDRIVDVNKEYTYRMPVLTSDDWESILNNVCMVTFMQGLPTGYNRKFNNYAVVKSSNNNTYVTPDSLYFVAADELESRENVISDENYHKLDCPYLGNLATKIQTLTGDRSAEFKYDARRINSLVTPGDESPNPTIIAFEDDETHTFYEPIEVEGSSDEVTVGDKIADPTKYKYKGAGPDINLNDPNNAITGPVVKYLFDHRHLGCYDCIISGNYNSIVKYYDGDLYLTGINDKTGEIFIYYNGQWLNDDGTPYTGTQEIPHLILSNEDKYGYGPCPDPNAELQKRRQALFNALGKYKETQYKNNQYINL